ncbi:MAG: arsenate reductase/protein-tyrosine-phosphatase family protein [Phycisphaerales bacterium]
MFSALTRFLADRSLELASIGPDRRAALRALGATISDILAESNGGGERGGVDVLFICTHNSRRSHMAQLWTAAIADHLGLPRVRTWSGGTEATAFHPHAIGALRRAGFVIGSDSDDVPNAVQSVRWSDGSPPAACFSKVYDQPPNPGRGFVAVMVCDEADEACPIVHGARGRFSLPYADPKRADGTPYAERVYDERCAQIAREMLFMMRSVGAGG